MRKDFEWLNDASQKFLDGGYLNGQPTEERLREISDYAESILDIEGFSNKFYSYLAKGWVSLASPVWSNFGNDRGLPVSCFSLTVGDSVPEILYAVSEVGEMSKLGGGTGGYVGNIRPRGSEIKDNGKTSGAVHFLELFSKTTEVISQGSTRRGRFSPYLPVDHGDIEEFLRIGYEEHPIQNMTHAVTVTDDWMEGMIAGDSDKRAIWAKVLQARRDNGYPYIMFKDNANNVKSDIYKDLDMDIQHSNLCVAPETLVLTKNGHVEISSLVDQEVEVWNGVEWSKVVPKKTSENEKLLKVTLSDGKTLDCTLAHKWYIQESYHGSPKEVRTHELKSGDKLIKFSSPVVEGATELENAYINGFFSGDGCQVGEKSRIYLYGSKRKLLENFPNRQQHCIQDKQNREYFNYPNLKPKFFIPSAEYDIASRIAWFAGLLDSDGTVLANGNAQSLQIASVEEGFLEQVSLMLQTLGVQSKVTLARPAGKFYLPANDGSGETKEFTCKEVRRLLVTQEGIKQLQCLGLSTNRLCIKDTSTQRNSSHFVTVVSVEDEGRVDDTYCFTEPKRHMGVFNGILTGQCSEILLPTNEEESLVCVLSSLNLLYYDEWKDTDLIETMVFFLDSVVTDMLMKLEKLAQSSDKEDQLAFHFMERAYNFAKRHRALGLGVLGWHSFLQSKMIPFESSEALEYTEEIFELIQAESYTASKALAEMFGEPEYCQGYGRRNTTLNAIAPTTSSAFILGQVSQSIEPYLSNCYVKDLANIKYTVKNPHLEKLLEEKGKNTVQVWDSISKNDGSVEHLDFLSDHEKAVFRSFRDISPKAVLEQAAVRQLFLDQTQSLNIMIDTRFTPKEVNQLVIDAWKLGIPTLYYQRNTNAAQDFARLKRLSCESCEA